MYIYCCILYVFLCVGIMIMAVGNRACAYHAHVSLNVQEVTSSVKVPMVHTLSHFASQAQTVPLIRHQNGAAA